MVSESTSAVCRRSAGTDHEGGAEDSRGGEDVAGLTLNVSQSQERANIARVELECSEEQLSCSFAGVRRTMLRVRESKDEISCRHESGTHT
jgi:hypothetical protein